MSGCDKICKGCNENCTALIKKSQGDMETSKEISNNVNHPYHYGGKDNPYEAIKVIEAWNLGFCLGNTVKYISRAGKKGNKIEDLEKALWYLEREIKKLKNEK